MGCEVDRSCCSRWPLPAQLQWAPPAQLQLGTAWARMASSGGDEHTDVDSSSSGEEGHSGMHAEGGVESDEEPHSRLGATEYFCLDTSYDVTKQGAGYDATNMCALCSVKDPQNSTCAAPAFCRRWWLILKHNNTGANVDIARLIRRRPTSLRCRSSMRSVTHQRAPSA